MDFSASPYGAIGLNPGSYRQTIAEFLAGFNGNKVKKVTRSRAIYYTRKHGSLLLGQLPFNQIPPLGAGKANAGI